MRFLRRKPNAPVAAEAARQDTRVAPPPYPAGLRDLGEAAEAALAGDEAFAAALLHRALPRVARLDWGRPSLLRERFGVWQDAGFTLLPCPARAPVPHVTHLPAGALEREPDTSAVDWDEPGQIRRVQRLADRFADEIETLGLDGDPRHFRFANHHFESGDAELMYGLLRALKPARVLEYGPGPNTLVAAAALAENAREGAEAEFVSVGDRWPEALADAEGAPRVEVLAAREVPDAWFDRLEAGDCLLLDTSHVLAPGSDVERLLFEVLPRLAPGVVVHLHDIFLPGPYPAAWAREEHVFWNEQQAVLAFLMYNSAWRIVASSAYLHRRRPDVLSKLAPSYEADVRDPASLWISRGDVRL